MDGEQIYKMANSFTNMTDRKAYLSRLTEEQKKLYTKYNNKVRQDRFKANQVNKDKYNVIRKEYIAEKRKEQPEKYKEQNKKDVKTFRNKEREQKKILNDKLKSLNTLTDAIKARKARQEIQIKAIERANKTDEDLQKSIKKTKQIIKEGKAKIKK